MKVNCRRSARDGSAFCRKWCCCLGWRTSGGGRQGGGEGGGHPPDEAVPHGPFPPARLDQAPENTRAGPLRLWRAQESHRKAPQEALGTVALGRSLTPACALGPGRAGTKVPADGTGGCKGQPLCELCPTCVSLDCGHQHQQWVLCLTGDICVQHLLQDGCYRPTEGTGNAVSTRLLGLHAAGVGVKHACAPARRPGLPWSGPRAGPLPAAPATDSSTLPPGPRL